VSRQKQIKLIIITDAVYTGYSTDARSVSDIAYSIHLSLSTTGQREEWRYCFQYLIKSIYNFRNACLPNTS